ncbi:MAG: HlyD family efflux transporter periplasmic adaptor subunit [Geminicoccaceae bacterium]
MIRRICTALAACVLVAACDEPAPAGLQGYVEGDYLRMAAPAAGWIALMSVDRGAQVEPGTLLFRLEDTEQQAAVRQAEGQLEQARATLADLRLGRRPEEIQQLEASLAQAKAARDYALVDLDRQEKLTRTDAASRSKLDQARATARETEAQVAAAEAALATGRLPSRTDQIAAAEAAVAMMEANLAQARWMLDQRTVRAPQAAKVDDTVRRAGEWVNAGGTVISLLPPENVKVRFFVPERDLAAVRVGQEVGLRCDGCPDGLKGTVSFVAPEAEFTPPVIYSVGSREKLVFMVEARPTKGVTLNPGQPVDVDLGTGTHAG